MLLPIDVQDIILTQVAELEHWDRLQLVHQEYYRRGRNYEVYAANQALHQLAIAREGVESEVLTEWDYSIISHEILSTPYSHQFFGLYHASDETI